MENPKQNFMLRQVGQSIYSRPIGFGQMPVLVIFVLKCSLLKDFDLLLYL